MKKVLYLKVPQYFKKMHKSIQGKKVYKGIWGAYDLRDYIDQQLSLIIMTEDDWVKNIHEVNKLPKNTKLVVISDNFDILEISDGIITKTNVLKTKTESIDLNVNPQDLYLWSLADQIITKCQKCSNIVDGSLYQCDCCGSQAVEIAQARNLLR